MVVKDAVRQSRADETRRLLLDAAQTVFSHKGYHDTSMDEIVRAADRSKGAAYFHFPAKSEIFRAVMNRLADRLERKVQLAVSRETTPVCRLEAALNAVLEAFTGHRRVAKLALVELVGAGAEFQDALAELRLRFCRLIQTELDRGIENGTIAQINSRLVSMAWFGAINEIVLAWLRNENPTDLSRTISELRKMLIRSVIIHTNTDMTLSREGDTQ